MNSSDKATNTFQKNRISANEIDFFLKKIQKKTNRNRIPFIPGYCLPTTFELKNTNEIYDKIFKSLNIFLNQFHINYINFLVNELGLDEIDIDNLYIFQYGFEYGIQMENEYKNKITMRLNLFQKNTNVLVLEIQRRKGDVFDFYILFNAFKSILDTISL